MAVYRRASGKWAVLIDFDRDAKGHRKRKSIGTFSTRKDAERAEREALTARDRGIDISPSTVTVKELVERHISHLEAVGRAAKTIEEYNQKTRTYIVPHLGTIAVGKLRPAHVSEWVAMSLLRGGKDGRALSAKTVCEAFSILNGSLRWALKMQITARNVCEAVTLPTSIKAEAKPLDAAEVGRLLDVSRSTRWGSFVALALATGARRGELLALTWNDIDTKGKTLTIRASLSQTKRDGVRLKTTKTGKVRTVPLSGMALDALRRQHAMQAEDRLRAGSAYENAEAAVFTNELGARLTPMAATCAFARLASKAKLATSRLHDLRHTTATALLIAGTDVRTTAGVLGHSTPIVTLGTYAHLMADTQRAAVERLGEQLERLA